MVKQETEQKGQEILRDVENGMNKEPGWIVYGPRQGRDRQRDEVWDKGGGGGRGVELFVITRVLFLLNLKMKSCVPGTQQSSRCCNRKLC